MNESNAMALADNAMGAVDWDALHERSRAIFDAVHRGSSLALQSGLYGTPPERPDMTRALPNYEQRDPNELAMLRHREMVRPSAGRQDFPIEHVANMATAAAMFSPVGAGPIGAVLAPEFAAGRAIAAGTNMAANYAPKATTAGLAAGGTAILPSMAGGAENQQASLPRDPQGIMALQTKLRDVGLYRGEIDGIMKPNGPTERAFKQFQEQETARRAEELQRQQLETQQGANTAALETARANQDTAKAKLEADRLQAERDAAERERKIAGDERLRDIEKNLSPMSRAIRDYSGPLGYLAGAAVGTAGRYAATSANNYISRGKAAAGDALMAEEIAGPAASVKGVARTAAQDAANMKRVARANDFWRTGGAKEVPFTLTPGQAPGYAANPNVTNLAQTYNPKIHPVLEATTTALPAAEATWAYGNEQDAKQEIKEATEAYSKDPSEANIQRINKANDNLAIWEGAGNFGRVWAGTNLGGAIASRYMKPATGTQPAKFAAAEAEQLALQKSLRDAQAKADAAAKKAGKKAPSVLEQRSQELGISPQVGIPPAIGPAGYLARQLK